MADKYYGSDTGMVLGPYSEGIQDHLRATQTLRETHGAQSVYCITASSLESARDLLAQTLKREAAPKRTRTAR